MMFSVSATAATLNLGVKGGMSLGTLTGKGVEDMDSGSTVGMKPAFNGYGFFSADLSSNLGLQAELGYVSKGKVWKDPDNDKNSISMNFSYLEIPLLVKGMFPMGAVKPMIYAGPTFGLMLSSTIGEKSDSPSFDTTITIEDSLRNGFEMGIALGGGTSYEVGPGAIILDIRYTIGLTSLLKLTQDAKDAGIKEEDIVMKTGTLGIMIGYQFKL